MGLGGQSMFRQMAGSGAYLCPLHVRSHDILHHAMPEYPQHQPRNIAVLGPSSLPSLCEDPRSRLGIAILIREPRIVLDARFALRTKVLPLGRERSHKRQAWKDKDGLYPEALEHAKVGLDLRDQGDGQPAGRCDKDFARAFVAEELADVVRCIDAEPRVGERGEGEGLHQATLIEVG